MKYQNLFIDLDDTIWDFRANSKVALEIVYDQYGLNEYYPLFDEYYRIYSERNTELWSLYHHGRISKENLVAERFRYPLQRIGIHNDKLVSQLNTDYLSALSEQGLLVEGAKVLLDYLKGRSYRLHIISNGFKEVQFKKMKSAGIDSYFEEVVLSDEIGVNKPHPDIFKYALEKTSSSRDTSLMIGDNYDADILGAMRSGIDQIYFNPFQKHIPDEHPTYEVRILSEIHDIL
ncbi:YjjG family noncanonical pyrimidine nucleotidase [Coprobacter sp.]